MKFWTDIQATSKSEEYETPQDLFNKLNKAFSFTLDVCATSENAKCRHYFTKDEDGLAQDWTGNRCWMNPPYGKQISWWVRKAYESAMLGALVVCLLPARTDTQWWQKWVAKGDVHFIGGRVKFGSEVGPAPFPSAIVIFWPKP